MVAVEFPAEWDEGVDNHGVYGEESYHEGDVDDTYQQDEQGEQEEANRKTQKKTRNVKYGLEHYMRI